MKLFKAPVNVNTKELILVDQKLYFPQVDALHIPLHSWFGWQEGFTFTFTGAFHTTFIWYLTITLTLIYFQYFIFRS